MSGFARKWFGKRRGVKDGIKEALAPKRGLKERIKTAITSISIQRRRLDIAIMRLKEKDKYYYIRILNSLRMRDRKRAVIYANELAEVRKALKTINYVKLVMEQVELRLSTINDIGEAASKLSPLIPAIKSVTSSLSEVLPQAEEDLLSISDLLNRILIDASQGSGVAIDFSASSLEAEKILREAEKTVEKEMREKLPPVPITGSEKLEL